MCVFDHALPPSLDSKLLRACTRSVGGTGGIPGAWCSVWQESGCTKALWNKRTNDGGVVNVRDVTEEDRVQSPRTPSCLALHPSLLLSPTPPCVQTPEPAEGPARCWKFRSWPPGGAMGPPSEGQLLVRCSKTWAQLGPFWQSRGA